MTPQDPDSELREELEYHLARRAELNQTTLNQARQHFGNPTLIQEELRAMRIPIWFDGLRQDLSYAFRTFTKNPGFTAASIRALALGCCSGLFPTSKPTKSSPSAWQRRSNQASGSSGRITTTGATNRLPSPA